MPKETFFRLSEEKKRRIMLAAKEEFSGHPLKEASIANIIKLADIPRGSFYQYFEGIEDLYYYYFSQLRKMNQKTMAKLLRDNEGDIFATFSLYFEGFIKEVLTGENAHFYKHLLLGMDERAMHHLSKKIVKPEKKSSQCTHKSTHGRFPDLFPSDDVNLKRLKLASKNEVSELVHLIMHMLFSTVMQAYRKEKEPNDDLIKETIIEFERKLDWLEHGVTNPKEGI